MDKIRLLFVVGSLGIGGTEKQLYLLLKYLDRERFLPRVVCLSEQGYWINRVRGLKIDVVEFKRRRGADVGRLLRLVRILATWKPDIVHAFQPPGNTYAGLAVLLTGCAPLILSYRSFHPFKRSPNILKGCLDRLVYRHSDAVVCNSQSLQDHLDRRFHRKLNTMVIYNGIDPVPSPSSCAKHELKTLFRIPDTARIVGTVGRIVPVKNHLLFLDIAHEVLKTVPDTRFVLVGDGPLKTVIQRRSRDIGISDKVIFAGERPDAYRMINGFDIFLLTTANGGRFGEGFPNVVMEAMANKVPCVVSGAGGTCELFADGEAGYLVNSSCKDAYAKRILALLADPALMGQMGNQGSRIVFQKYGTDRMIRQFEMLYDSLRCEKSGFRKGKRT